MPSNPARTGQSLRALRSRRVNRQVDETPRSLPAAVTPAERLEFRQQGYLVIDSGLGALLAVEPVGGDRVIVSK